MGLIQDGKWVDQWYDTSDSGGEFRRQDSRFRSWLTADGQPGPQGEKGFKAEKGRYHLYVSLACPWAHRTLIFRQLKNLQDYIDVTVVDPIMLENGWEVTDPLYGFQYAYQLYMRADSQYEGRVTVPVLWDKQTQTIVSNESSEIIRMFNSAFNHLTGNTDDYYPEGLRESIDMINERIYDCINNGVYRAGFATTQEAYEDAYHQLFDALDWVEGLLSKQRYLCGSTLTEADWRLFTTLIRFDAVYFGHFKTNRQLIASYPAMSSYVRELYQVPGVAQTVNFEHIKTHYYASHLTINPTGVIPLGPEQDFDLPHDRDQLEKAN
ncbi:MULTISPECIES: glutathione S-transferase family protein [unclassified Oleiphilus]|uniref:glutathione S-transferase family protein n=1 Tax=unclassified Oleiphilus TaxID=2631174 RepID=UPI0007C24911|nr:MULTISPECIES: glutathione S-transferase family protein [unclassified Oleiphilus]KZY40222.1 glutathione-dependent reductase [Oleiphilus sp. HI0050]KZZ36684.1 glutathione-dependent reductase [Oleiphilus sp. HI0086]KZZ38606.1 glutathione-dependent reductase [Oleiphilus sp. HI0117]KZZ55339.1 glutathione-dependent reductase [Oleiphilus sp. HI0123]KZZ60207.1 glutathione-dependent reductase [Oleiphilus sp. HI0123]